MYEAHFGFNERPFSSVPRTERYFPGEAIESARQTLSRCVDRAEGCGLVVGPAGTGKTLMCHVLAEDFRERLEIVLLSSVQLSTRKELLQAILFELGLPHRRMHEGELRLSLIDRLSPGACNEAMLLIVDEAHSLSPKLMEELRLLTNLVRGGTPRVRLVLAGSPILDERFASPRMASFNQRLVARCYLESLSSAETQEYVRAQTAAAGVQPESCWTPDGLQAVYHATDGCPRLINQVCDHALLLAATAGANLIDANRVNQAWADLQQLPMPWNEERDSRLAEAETEHQPTAVIEFGSLDADDHVESHEPAEPTLEETVVEDEPVAAEVEINFDCQPPTQARPHEQLEQIESHLAQVEDSFDDGLVHPPTAPIPPDEAAQPEPLDHTPPPAEPAPELLEEIAQHEVVESESQESESVSYETAKCQIELDFDDFGDADVIANDDPEQHLDDEQVVIDDFAGLEGDNVVHLVPQIRTFDDEESTVDEGQKTAQAKWFQDVQRAVAEDECTDQEDLVAPMPSVVSQHADDEIVDASVHSHSEEMPAIADCDEEAPASAEEDLDIFVMSAGPETAIEYSSEIVDVPAEPGVEPKISDAVEAAGDTVTQSTPGVTEQPGVPVQQNDFRQLFAKLRSRTDELLLGPSSGADANR